MIAMIVGGLLVAGLVVWALTRTVQPVPAETTATFPVTGVEQTASTPAATPAGDTSGTSGYVPAPPAGTTAPTSTYQPNPPSQDENASVARIALADLRAKVDAKQVMVIDVRDKTSYISSHIPGAYHVPMATVESQVSFLPKDKPIVTYCT